MLTYDVRIWSVRSRPSKSSPFQLRWRVGPQVHYAVFANVTLADGRRSELMSAVRRGEQFDSETGLPATELRERRSPTWYEHACAYALMKWPRAAAKHRVGIAESLTIVTLVLVSSDRAMPDRVLLRRALRTGAFQMCRTEEGVIARKDAHPLPDEESEALAWIARNSLKMAELGTSERMRAALTALSLKLDGTAAADNTFRRRRTTFNNALRYAVERDLLTVNPLSRIDWEPPDTDDEVDFRYVPEPDLALSLIRAVGSQGTRGDHLEAFFGCLYYAALRPSEAAALGRKACMLPVEEDEAAWGELVLSESRPEVGSGWTDDGLSYEKRGLKRRARKATRSVPIPPVLVRMLREHMRVHGTAADGRLFRAAGGGRVRSTEYTELWQAARREVLSAEEVEAPLAEVPYCLRQAGISLWIRAGADPVEAARRAGHSVAVLFRFYAKILRGVQHRTNELISEALANQQG
ncbi:site-specific integrase [Streptomyces sp. NBC_00669]|uniref:tyrosine-type recombinase/integrase n=1 Tax=Streptomyces sp. NBC_00669 TaxID=2976011 RepID=UPI002E3269C3|nr:site-specific integrase [Streptomyces sp. NBC_00669]